MEDIYSSESTIEISTVWYARCQRCSWRSLNCSTRTEAKIAGKEHQHRTICQQCEGPYDEDTDAWGVCAACLVETL